MKTKEKKLAILRDAWELAMLYLPLLALWDIIALKCGFDITFLLPVISGILGFCALAGENRKDALNKWLLSIPFTALFGVLLSLTNFEVRLINIIYPGYGTLSAGGGFASMVEWLIFSLILGAFLLAAFIFGGVFYKRLEKLRALVQKLVLPVICVLILLSVLYFEATMPTWADIYSSVYG